MSIIDFFLSLELTEPCDSCSDICTSTQGGVQCACNTHGTQSLDSTGSICTGIMDVTFSIQFLFQIHFQQVIQYIFLLNGAIPLKKWYCV